MTRHAILSDQAVITDSWITPPWHPIKVRTTTVIYTLYIIPINILKMSSQAADSAQNPSSSHAGTSAETKPRQPIWLRCEKKPFEHRSALTPTTAKVLLDNNFDVMIERDPQRIFEDEEFEA